MWERFTTEAKEAVLFASYEAQQLNEHYVSTEHLLLGLLRRWQNASMQSESVWPPPPKTVLSAPENWQVVTGEQTRIGALLNQTGVSASKIIADLTSRLASGNHQNNLQDMQLTPRGLKAIRLASEEAKRLAHEEIRPEHLLLGLVRESEGLAGRVLRKNRVNLARLRDAAAGDGSKVVSNEPWWKSLLGK